MQASRSFFLSGAMCATRANAVINTEHLHLPSHLMYSWEVKQSSILEIGYQRARAESLVRHKSHVNDMAPWTDNSRSTGFTNSPCDNRPQ
ncbi:hypothetical protein EV356DRAFT_503701 [Viridothelium virens]|uniref:Uncharacterized protein n=1 Tax=Viridothelium virens TaxID=1048519 RepID=A0A6A6H696_VIRVR|nr:hypothetical protein EV356DRAFT_503701 [Viridothelium virens]